MSSSSQRPGLRLRTRRELWLLGSLYLAYSVGRLLAHADLGVAKSNAHQLLSIEQWLHIDVEHTMNHALMGVPALALAASYWYAMFHYIVTPTIMVWVYRAHAWRYRQLRRALVIATAIGVVGFVLVPMAPPRMLHGYIDVMAATATHGWWGADASAPRGLASLTNQLAAMPSLHVGWALWCTWAIYLCTRNRWLRALGVFYGAGTALVVIATANHYVLDAVAGAAVLGIGILLASRPVPLPGPRQVVRFVRGSAARPSTAYASPGIGIAEAFEGERAA